MKRAGESSNEFKDWLKQRQEEQEAKEKAEWEALSDEERQSIIAEKERIGKEREAREQEEKRKALLQKWKKHGVTERFYEAEWDNWVANTPEKIRALKAAGTAWEQNLFFTGKNGTGKTHLAMCLAKDGAMYREYTQICDEIKSDFERERETLDFYSNQKLLLIDEIGRQKISDFSVNTMFEIINRRWNNVLPTTIITNFSWQEFANIYGQAVVDRFRPAQVQFNWESMRGAL